MHIITCAIEILPNHYENLNINIIQKNSARPAFSSNFIHSFSYHGYEDPHIVPGLHLSRFLSCFVYIIKRSRRRLLFRMKTSFIKLNPNQKQTFIPSDKLHKKCWICRELSDQRVSSNSCCFQKFQYSFERRRKLGEPD